MTALAVAVMDLAVKAGTRLVQPVDITADGESVPLPNGTRAKMQIRPAPGSATLLAEFTTENGRLAVDAGNARVTITMTSALTAGFAFERAVYDLVLIYPDNEQEAIVQGKVYVFPAITL